VPREAELADDDRVARSRERPRHLDGNRDAATREPDDDDRVAADHVRERRPQHHTQLPAGVDPIGEHATIVTLPRRRAPRPIGPPPSTAR
jgi:hypothetical protein